MKSGVVRTLVAAAVLLAGSGCGTLGNYPICVIDTGDAPPDVLWDKARPDLQAVMRLSIVGGDSRVSLTPAGALLNGFSWEHSALRSIWPNYACIVSLQSPSADILRRLCQAEIESYFMEGRAVWPGPINQVGSSCANIY